MSIPVHALTQAQRYWYAQMVVAAILSDNEITHAETEFIKQTIEIVKRSDEKQKLLRCIASKTAPYLSGPPGIPPKVLAAIFLELSLILISDLDFSDPERKFLEEIGQLYGFTYDYYLELLKWCEQGLAWKNRQRELVSELCKSERLKVPVSELNEEQRNWYAQTLVSTILSDSQLDKEEVVFLKMAIALVNDSEHKRELLKQVSSHIAPPLSQPPGFSNEILVLIFFEVMLIVSADEELGVHEQMHLKRLSDLCGFPDFLFKSLLQWCRLGVKWKQSKNPLIARCKTQREKWQKNYQVISGEKTLPEIPQVFSAEKKSNDLPVVTSSDKENAAGNREAPVVKEETPVGNEEAPAVEEPRPETQPNPENNSITDVNQECYVCGSEKKVKFFQLDPKSQKPVHNIFGIPTYRISAEGFDFVDYNRCKVAICPHCFFTSPQKTMFRLKKETSVPKPLQHPELSSTWLKSLEERKEFLMDHLQEIPSINRSLPMIIKSYQLAIKTSDTLTGLNKSIEQSWHTMTLKLTLAEVLMNNGQQSQAIRMLRQIRNRASEVFESTKSNMISFRSGRLLTLISLYFGNAEAAKKYFDFFSDVKDRKFGVLSKQEQILFQRIFGEIKRAYENPKDYLNTSLKGFQKNK